MPNHFRLRFIFAALFLSGLAGLANQVLWQRGLKAFLGGSETLSAMLAVMVFMLGLGLGALGAGALCHRFRHPLRAFAWVELGLFVTNLVVAYLLHLDLRESVVGAQRLALSLGLPLRLVYACGAAAILLPPTLLMGATLPLAADAAQRQLRISRPSVLVYFFVVNTCGAAVGAFAAIAYGLPYLGQARTLVLAATCNLAAAALLSTMARATRLPEAIAAPAERRAAGRWSLRLGAWERLGFAFGFLALGYEMHLLRSMTLAHGPRPYTFALSTCSYLVLWSAGVLAAPYLAKRSAAAVTACGLLLAGLVASMPSLHGFDRSVMGSPLAVSAVLYTLPCPFFGLLYGVLVTRTAKAWGRDIGRFYGNSYFVDPRGSTVVEASEDQDELVVAELDLDIIEEVRRVWQFYRDRRPESYEDLTALLP